MEHNEFLDAFEKVHWAQDLNNDGYQMTSYYDEIKSDQYAKVYEFKPS